ncbi:MAG: fumarate hydratase, partial [Candidatus Thorarchaeota archaeon]
MKDPMQVIEDTTFRLLKLAVTKLPKDVETALRAARDREDNETAKTQLSTIIQNMDIADAGIPMCQDTGIIIYYVKVGSKFPFMDDIKEALIKATKKATA